MLWHLRVCFIPALLSTNVNYSTRGGQKLSPTGKFVVARPFFPRKRSIPFCFPPFISKGKQPILYIATHFKIKRRRRLCYFLGNFLFHSLEKRVHYQNLHPFLGIPATMRTFTETTRSSSSSLFLIRILPFLLPSFGFSIKFIPRCRANANSHTRNIQKKLKNSK